MKKLVTYLGFFIAGLAASSQVHAKIWRVNNNPNIKADFTTAQDAVTGASAGDTIHLEPSPSDYGPVNLIKRLVLVGVGNFLSVNPDNQVKTLTAAISTITITNSAASGSVIMVTINGVSTVTGVTNITFRRCYVGRNFNLTNSDDTRIENCFINDENRANYAISIRMTNCKNAIVINNLLISSITMDINSSAIISNNTMSCFNATGGFGTDIPKIFNSQFINNIINKTQPITFDAASTIQYNFSSTSLPTNDNNIPNYTNQNMTNILVNPKGSFDNDFLLSSASLAKSAGLDGVDCGAFGGAMPFVLAEQPAIPAIYKLTIPATAAGDSLHVIFSTKSNN